MDLPRLVGVLRARGGDLSDVEVKSGAGGLPDSVTETLSAFANLPGGGLIVLGLDESAAFRPVGLKHAASLAAGLASRARQAMEPARSLRHRRRPFRCNNPPPRFLAVVG